MKGFYQNPQSRVDGAVIESLDDHFEQTILDGECSSVSVDGLSSETPSFSLRDLLSEHGQSEDGASSSDGSSPLGWRLVQSEKCLAESSLMTCKSIVSPVLWEQKKNKRGTDLSEVEMMKERFAKLLLGEDMSGGKGVCTALAISNAITNLSASVFVELWRLEPLSPERKTMWRREIEWLLSVANHIVELTPSWQAYPDGSTLEVMVSRPRSDLHINLPALRKLDTMLLESLDSFTETEFWYVDQGIIMADEENHDCLISHQQDKWWLPSPKVPVHGLSDEARKHLQHQRECVSQILKAAMAINSQVLLEMEVPNAYWESLPKTVKARLGETIYKHIASEYFSPETLLCSLDLSKEHNALNIANRVEAAIHVWRRKNQLKQLKSSRKPKVSWGIVKDLVLDIDRRELFAGRAERFLLCLKQRFPGLPQTLLDVTKIQYNRDVGKSILESYSRVVESLAFNIIARVDEVLHVDSLTKHSLPSPAQIYIATSKQRHDYFLDISVSAPFVTPVGTPITSPTSSPSPQRTNTPFHCYDCRPQGTPLL